jgi:sugar (pentulose or hexulose) kinase
MSGLVIGMDIGTSGVRCVAMDGAGEIAAQTAVQMADHGADGRDAMTWKRAASAALHLLVPRIDAKSVCALAVDGTSGTMLPIDKDGLPLAPALMYSDPVGSSDILTSIAARAPAESAARGATSGLAKAMVFRNLPGLARVVHQADWIAGMLSGRFDVSDENNALKTGYDPVHRQWPEWISILGMHAGLLPKIVPAGCKTGRITLEAAKAFGIPTEAIIVAGTTDGCASFLATGAHAPGEGVSALGSSLTIKLLSDRPVNAPQFGIYSHRIGDKWLAGGASNTGGKVLAAHFSAARIAELSMRIDPETNTGLDYYPLAADGERFPIADPSLKPRMLPRPKDDAEFLKAILEGIANIEALGYRRLAELGCPPLASVRSVGGGAANQVWTRIRARKLGVPMLTALSGEAAAGTAQLALQGARAEGLI